MAQATKNNKGAPPQGGGIAQTAAAPRRQVYLGPNLPGLAHGSIFRDGLPAPVEALLAGRPGLADCFRPLEGLVAAKLELADPDSRLSRAYRDAARPGVGGGKRA